MMNAIPVEPSPGLKTPEATDAPPPRHYVYGKHCTQRRFRPMNLRERSRVVNLIFASRLTDADVQRFMREEAPRNTDWTFEPHPIPGARRRAE